MKSYYFEEDDFNYYYVIKADEKYFFSKRSYVCDLGLAKKFNTERSAKRIIKLYKLKNYKIIKLMREFT